MAIRRPKPKRGLAKLMTRGTQHVRAVSSFRAGRQRFNMSGGPYSTRNGIVRDYKLPKRVRSRKRARAAAVGLAHGGPSRKASWGVKAQKYLVTIPRRSGGKVGGVPSHSAAAYFHRRKKLGTAMRQGRAAALRKSLRKAQSASPRRAGSGGRSMKQVKAGLSHNNRNGIWGKKPSGTAHRARYFRNRLEHGGATGSTASLRRQAKQRKRRDNSAIVRKAWRTRRQRTTFK